MIDEVLPKAIDANPIDTIAVLDLILSNLINFGILLATAIGLMAVFRQIKETRKSNDREFARLKIVDTLDFYNKSRSIIRDNHQKVIALLNDNLPNIKSTGLIPLNQTQVDFIMSPNGKQVKNFAIDTLSLLERLALGVSFGIYDEKIIDRLSRTQICSYFGYYSLYIAVTRIKTENAYCELETLATRFMARSISEGIEVAKACKEATRQGLLPLPKKSK